MNVSLWQKHPRKVTVDAVTGIWHVAVQGSSETRTVTPAEIVEKAESEHLVYELQRLIGDAHRDILVTIETAAQK